MRSINLRAVDDQGVLPLARKPDTHPVAEEVVFRCRSFTAALALSVNVSGLEEKEIYLALGIDAGHWTRIMKGDAHFPVNKLNDFAALVGNDIPLMWWANSRGQGLHPLESELERRLRIEQEKLERIVAENKLLRELVAGRAVA